MMSVGGRSDNCDRQGGDQRSGGESRGKRKQVRRAVLQLVSSEQPTTAMPVSEVATRDWVHKSAAEASGKRRRWLHGGDAVGCVFWV